MEDYYLRQALADSYRHDLKMQMEEPRTVRRPTAPRISAPLHEEYAAPQTFGGFDNRQDDLRSDLVLIKLDGIDHTLSAIYILLIIILVICIVIVGAVGGLVVHAWMRRYDR